MKGTNPGTILLSLVQGEEGRQWAKNKKGWNSFTVDPVCTWEGVLCDEQAEVIVEAIFLPKTGIPGTIPSELGKLTTLKAITIPQGQLRGTIPSEIAKLPHLEIINLSQNKLTGSIPAFESPHLRSLDLGYNQFTGTLPSNICDGKKKMTDFDIIRNKISGYIPSCFSIMGSLVTLSLSENLFSGSIPSSFGDLMVLEYLYLDNNFLMGMIPPSIARVDSTLREFWLQENLLSGTIPATLADVTNLKDFYIDGNKFTGTVPSDLCRSEINSDFFENVDASIERDYCQSIACPVNYVSVEGVYPCVPCTVKYYNPYLGRIGMCSTLNQREILESLYESANGRMWIGASNWSLKDTFICDFTGITCDSNNHIISINLKGRGLTGTIPGSIGFLKYLTNLDLSDNELTGFLPSDLRFAPIQSLDVSGNKLRGIVPNTLCLKSHVNGNGQGGDYNCENIACPVGYFSKNGYAVKDTKCMACSDSSAKFLGAKTCHKPAVHHVIGGKKNFAGFVFVLGCLGSVVYVIFFIVRKKKDKMEHVYGMARKSEQSSNIYNSGNNDSNHFVEGYSDKVEEKKENIKENSGDRESELAKLKKVDSQRRRESTLEIVKSSTTDWLDVPDI